MLMCFPITHQLGELGAYASFQWRPKFANLKSAKYPSLIDHKDPTSFKNSEPVSVL